MPSKEQDYSASSHQRNGLYTTEHGWNPDIHHELSFFTHSARSLVILPVPTLSARSPAWLSRALNVGNASCFHQAGQNSLWYARLTCSGMAHGGRATSRPGTTIGWDQPSRGHHGPC